MKCCQSKSCPWMPIPIEETSIIVFKPMLIDVIAALHALNLTPPDPCSLSSARPLKKSRIIPSAV